MRVALVVAGKELRQRLRDRSALIIAFVAPTLLAAIVTGAFGAGFGPDDFGTEVAVVDEDGSDIAAGFTEVLEGLDDLIGTRAAGSEAEARELLEADEVSGAYVIGAGFGDDVAAGRRARLEVLTDARSPISASIVEAVATGFTEQVNATRLAIFTAVRASASGEAPAEAPPPEELAAAAVRDRIPVQLVDASVGGREVSGANYFGPAMAIFFLFFIVASGARSLYAEREQGTMPRVLAAPTSAAYIVLGKAAATFVLGLASLTSVYVAMALLFGVDWGDPLAIAALTVGTVASLMAIVALVQTLARTEQQAASYGNVIGIGLAVLGGNFFPLFQLPPVMQTVSALTPNGWALRGFTDVAYDGAGLLDLGPHMLALGVFTLLCGGVATLRARRLTVAA